MQEEFVPIRVTVNGITHHMFLEARRSLLDVLREDLGLTGTNAGCEQGSCGSCTVLLDGKSIRSCLLFAVQANNHEVMTVEGLARDGKMHPLQEAFWEQQALQCGFCTPGFLMTAYDVIRTKRAIRQFTDQPISDEVTQTIINAGRLILAMR